MSGQNKKQLKEAYKQMKFRMGVFQIRNKLNNKVFIEGSVNLDKIWNRHRLQLNFGNHPNTQLQEDWKQLGEEQFVYEILGELPESDKPGIDYNKEVKALEQLYLEELAPYGERGYHNS